MDTLRALWSPKWRWLTLTVAWLAVAGLALWGLAVGKPGSSIWDRLYAVPDFFSVSISDETAALDWRIQLARFLGPLAFASTFYAATALVFRGQIDRLRLRFVHDHVVVAGLGDKGARLAESFAEAGRRVVAIEPDPANVNRATVARRGVTLVTGQATDPQVLAEAGVARATDLVVVADDATNAEIVAVAGAIERDPADPALRASVHLIDPQLTRLLRTRELSAGSASVRLDFFNIFQRGARLWLAETDPLAPSDGRPPHVVVLGIGQLGEAVAVAAVQRWAERRDPDDEPLRLTLVDPDASARHRSLGLRHPALVAHATTTTIDLDPDRPRPGASEAFRDLLADGTVTAAYACHDDDTQALSTALFVRQGLGATPALVAVRTRSQAGLAMLVDGAETGAGIRGFPLYDRTCSADAIDGGTNEAIARALHDDYVTRARAGGQVGPTVVAWAALDRGTQESNRRVADGLVRTLAAVGCALAPLYGWDAAGFAFTDAEVERMAEAEHERWSDERRRSGWTHDVDRDDARKRHPLLVPWAELPEPEREKNRAASRQLPTVLARAGFEIVRRTPSPAPSPAHPVDQVAAIGSDGAP